MAAEALEVPGTKNVALVPSDPMQSIIDLASNPAMDVEKLQRLIDMRKEAMQEAAKASFDAAMSRAQRLMRPVKANRHNKQTHSDYADYAAIDAMARPIYTEAGFGLSFDTEESKLPDHVRVLCYVSHAGGFSRTYHVDMPADGKGAKGGDVMTKTHAAGSAFSYAQRYLLKLIFNIAIGDDDGNAAGGKSSAPEGFEDWLDNMERTAPNGLKALAAAWECSDVAYTKHIKVVDWEALKKIAKQADEKAKAVKGA